MLIRFRFVIAVICIGLELVDLPLCARPAEVQ